MSAVAKAHLALLAVNLIYAANYVIAKGVMPDYVQPSGFILIRVLGALLCFWLVKRMVSEKVEKKDFRRLIACGLFGVACNQLFFFEGLNKTSEINASIIMVVTPIIVMVLSAFVLKDRITGRKLAGLIIGGAGAILLITSGSKSGVGLDTDGLMGDLFILINATSYSLYLVLVKPLMSKYKPITVISWVFLFGALFVMISPTAIVQFVEIDWSSFTPGIWSSIIYVVLCTTFLAYLLNIFALKTVKPTVSSSYIYLQPVATGLFVWLFSLFMDTGKSVDYTWWKALCTLLIFVGVFLISFQRRSAGKASPES